MIRALIKKGMFHVFLILLGLFFSSGYAFSGEFQPDEHTLFLAHYNTSLNADYAQGSPAFETRDTGYLTTGNRGYFGEGLVARVGIKALKEAGAKIEKGGLLPQKAFDGLRYTTSGNLDLNQGTFECWYKPYFSIKRAEDMPESWPMIYTIFQYRQDAKRRFTLVFNQHMNGVFVAHFIIINGASQLDLSSRVNWKPGTWHHLAITWDTKGTNTASLFLDGKLVSRKSLSALKEGFPKYSSRFPFCIGSLVWRRAGNKFQFYKADGIIDEVRISNIVRYKEDFFPNPK